MQDAQERSRRIKDLLRDVETLNGQVSQMKGSLKAAILDQQHNKHSQKGDILRKKDAANKDAEKRLERLEQMMQKHQEQEKRQASEIKQLKEKIGVDAQLRKELEELRTQRETQDKKLQEHIDGEAQLQEELEKIQAQQKTQNTAMRQKQAALENCQKRLKKLELHIGRRVKKEQPQARQRQDDQRRLKKIEKDLAQLQKESSALKQQHKRKSKKKTSDLPQSNPCTPNSQQKQSSSGEESSQSSSVPVARRSRRLAGMAQSQAGKTQSQPTCATQTQVEVEAEVELKKPKPPKPPQRADLSKNSATQKRSPSDPPTRLRRSTRTRHPKAKRGRQLPVVDVDPPTNTTGGDSKRNRRIGEFRKDVTSSLAEQTETSPDILFSGSEFGSFVRQYGSEERCTQNEGPAAKSDNWPSTSCFPNRLDTQRMFEMLRRAKPVNPTSLSQTP